MKKHWRKIGLILLGILLLGFGIWCAWGNTALMIETIPVYGSRLPEAFDGFRIAQISDLHNAEFGEGNRRLLQLLGQTEPDIIVMTGDTIDCRRTDLQVAAEFVRGALEIAPVYFVTGNHEAVANREAQTLMAQISAMGATVLRGKAVEITRDGARLRLIGMEDLGYYAEDTTVEAAEAEFSEALKALRGEDDEFTLLLSHRPELAEIYADAGVDAVLAGHAHGGQIRLPLIGGLFAPGQGVLPKYDAGSYRIGNTQMVVCRGLGNSRFPLRINNRPEIVLVKLKHI